MEGSWQMLNSALDTVYKRLTYLVIWVQWRTHIREHKNCKLHNCQYLRKM